MLVDDTRLCKEKRCDNIVGMANKRGVEIKSRQDERAQVGYHPVVSGE